MTLEIIGQFIIYVLAFWGTWKIFDTIFHAFFPNTDRRQDQEIRDIKKQLGSQPSPPKEYRGSHSTSYDNLCRELKLAKDDRDRWRNKALEVVALQKMNTASPQQIELIYGCGPKTAQKIIRNRPFNNIQDVVHLIPGRSVRAILRWAERFV